MTGAVVSKGWPRNKYLHITQKSNGWVGQIKAGRGKAQQTLSTPAYPLEVLAAQSVDR